MLATIDLEDLGLDSGGRVLIRHALSPLSAGDRLEVKGRDPALSVQLRAWCRAEGHIYHGPEPDRIEKGRAEELRWSEAVHAGQPDYPTAHAEPRWGLAARGALVETGGPAIGAVWTERDYVWADIAPRLYAAAAAGQWDPATAVNWSATTTLPDDIEGAIVQVMTYLVENEQAALIVPATMIGRIHPQFREVQQLLAAQAADEARHVEIFSRRALLGGGRVGSSGAAGRASLQTLLDEPDFVTAGFLLSVLGEGTFLDLLRFLSRHAPDPVTADVTRLAAIDEARHVAFAMAHTTHVVNADPSFLGRLRQAVERRHATLLETAGLNDAVLDALVLLAAGSWQPGAIAEGWNSVERLRNNMDQGRQRRLASIGFPSDEAVELSALHTRNFM